MCDVAAFLQGNVFDKDEHVVSDVQQSIRHSHVFTDSDLWFPASFSRMDPQSQTHVVFQACSFEMK